VTAPLVWLPFDPADLGSPPADLRYEVIDPSREVPDSVADVAFHVLPYQLGSAGFDVLARMGGLRVLQTLTAGVDAVLPHVPEGVTLCSGRGIHDASTAELALTLVLAGLRGIPDAVRSQDRHEWAPRWRPALADKHVLVVGHGAIGAAIEARLLPFEVTVDRVARRARAGVHGMDALAGLLSAADVVIVVVPLTGATRGLVDAAFLSRLRDGALLVNVSRGPVVDQDALLAELTTGRITAAVDVTDPEPLPASSPLWSAPGLLVTPHVGGATSAMWPRAHRLVRDQLHRFAAGEPLLNVVDR
jgi:phosphoglycerate dehydrogenase-like enzyme